MSDILEAVERGHPDRLGSTGPADAGAFAPDPAAAGALGAGLEWQHGRSARLVRGSALLPDGARITVMAIGSVSAGASGADEIAAVLKAAGHDAQALVLPQADNDRRVIELMKEGCRSVEASGLVIGVYSHSRLKQRVFGGVTRWLLRDTPLPTIMVH